MKKLLTILSSFVVSTTTASTLVACGSGSKENKDNEVPTDPTDQTDQQVAQQDADAAKNELKALDITVHIGDDEKTKDKVIEHIKNTAEFKTIIEKYAATINELTVKLADDNSDLEDAKIANNIVLKFSGKLTVDAANDDFELTKVTLNVLTAAAEHKLEADTAATVFSHLQGITIKLADLGTTNKPAELIKKLRVRPEITAILIGDIKLENDQFTLKVGNVAATNTNLVINATVSVSGKIKVKEYVTQNEFNFTIKLDNAAVPPISTNPKIAAEKATNELKGLTVKKITFKESELGITNKPVELNRKLFANPNVATIMTNNNILIQNSAFILKVKELLGIKKSLASNKNLKAGATVLVSGRVKVGNGYISTKSFEFTIKIIK